MSKAAAVPATVRGAAANKKAAFEPAQAETSLVLRCCRADMSSHSGFVWPGVGGEAIAPEWAATNECGNGLHGWLHGAGDHNCSDYWSDADASWLVVEVESASIIMLGGKCKFPRGIVRFVGTKSDAAAYIIGNSAHALACDVIGAQRAVGDCLAMSVGALGTATAGDSGTAVAGDSGTAVAGDRGTATAGYGGTAVAGYGGTAVAGDRGTAVAGYGGTATAGDSGTAVAGERGTATAGDSGTAVAGDGGTATAGDSGTAVAGERGTATAGDSGTAVAGDSGTATAGYGGTAVAGDSGTAVAGDSGTAVAGYGGAATAGDRGELRIKWWDKKADRYRTALGYVGEGAIEPNVAYYLNDAHQFVRVYP